MTAQTLQARSDGEFEPDAYSARHLLVLEGLEAVRKRPGMYIGSTDSRGLMHCVWEIIDNAVDEALGGHCTRIEVDLHADGSVEVRDNGRGIPVDAEPRTGLAGVEVVMTRLHAGGKFGGGSYAATGGLHGVGASVVNALSARLDVEVDRGGKTHAISFRRGVPGDVRQRLAREPVRARVGHPGGRQGHQEDDRHPGALLVRPSDLPGRGRAVDRRAAQPRPPDRVPGAGADSDRARPAAWSRQRRFGQPSRSEETFRFDGGISEFCSFLAPDQSVSDVLRLQGNGHFKETVPVLDESGHMTSTEVERELGVDVALRWGTGYDTVLRSFVNIIATPKGGTHVAGFERALTKTVNEALALPAGPARE